MFHLNQKVILIKDLSPFKEGDIQRISKFWKCSCGLFCIETYEIASFCIKNGYNGTVCEVCGNMSNPNEFYAYHKFFAPLEEWEKAEEIVKQLLIPELCPV